MGKRGVSIRSHRAKVSRKNQKNLKLTKIDRSIVKEHWENGTLKDNYAALGIALNPNEVIDKPTEKKRKHEERQSKLTRNVPTKKAKVVEEWDVVDQEVAITGKGTREARRPKFWMSEEDIRVIKPMVDKHGQDINKIFRDLKVNPYQKTKGWLKKNITRYVNFMETDAGKEQADIVGKLVGGELTSRKVKKQD